MDRFDWTKEREAELAQYWTAGLTGSEIGALMGLTRNAVIGKKHRLGLSLRATSLTIEQIEERARKRREANARSTRRYYARNSSIINLRRKLERKPDLVAPDTTPIPLMQLTASTCRWPHGVGPYLFCGAPIEPKCVYCAYHAKIAYTPDPQEPRVRRRLPPRFVRAA